MNSNEATTNFAGIAQTALESAAQVGVAALAPPRSPTPLAQSNQNVVAPAQPVNMTYVYIGAAALAVVVVLVVVMKK